MTYREMMTKALYGLVMLALVAYLVASDTAFYILAAGVVGVGLWSEVTPDDHFDLPSD